MKDCSGSGLRVQDHNAEWTCVTFVINQICFYPARLERVCDKAEGWKKCQSERVVCFALFMVFFFGFFPFFFVFARSVMLICRNRRTSAQAIQRRFPCIHKEHQVMIELWRNSQHFLPYATSVLLFCKRESCRINSEPVTFDSIQHPEQMNSTLSSNCENEMCCFAQLWNKALFFIEAAQPRSVVGMGVLSTTTTTTTTVGWQIETASPSAARPKKIPVPVIRVFLWKFLHNIDNVHAYETNKQNSFVFHVGAVNKTIKQGRSSPSMPCHVINARDNLCVPDQG